ncbi:MAG: hypothetical protein LBF75_08660 [Treponema sp.]|nr:hypothetical protein [Treponema sp.]
MIVHSFGAIPSLSVALMAIISYGTFITLTAGFLLCIMWVVIHLIAYLGHKQAG